MRKEYLEVAAFKFNSQNYTDVHVIIESEQR